MRWRARPVRGGQHASSAGARGEVPRRGGGAEGGCPHCHVCRGGAGRVELRGGLGVRLGGGAGRDDGARGRHGQGWSGLVTRPTRRYHKGGPPSRPSGVAPSHTLLLPISPPVCPPPAALLPSCRRHRTFPPFLARPSSANLLHLPRCKTTVHSHPHATHHPHTTWAPSPAPWLPQPPGPWCPSCSLLRWPPPFRLCGGEPPPTRYGRPAATGPLKGILAAPPRRGRPARARAAARRGALTLRGPRTRGRGRVTSRAATSPCPTLSPPPCRGRYVG